MDGTHQIRLEHVLKPSLTGLISFTSAIYAFETWTFPIIRHAIGQEVNQTLVGGLLSLAANEPTHDVVSQLPTLSATRRVVYGRCPELPLCEECVCSPQPLLLRRGNESG